MVRFSTAGARRATDFARARLLRAGALGAGLLATSLIVGCGAGGHTPQDAVRDYAAAIDRGDHDRAWALLSSAHRERTPRPRGDHATDARIEAGETYVAQLRAAAGRDAVLTARLDVPAGRPVGLAHIDGAWRIVDGVGAFDSQETPEDAVRTFIAAVKANDVDVLMRLVPAEFRAQITAEQLRTWLSARAEELTRTIALLEASSDVEIRRTGDRATLRYGAEVMELVREDGRWVILDFD